MNHFLAPALLSIVVVTGCGGSTPRREQRSFALIAVIAVAVVLGVRVRTSDYRDDDEI